MNQSEPRMAQPSRRGWEYLSIRFPTEIGAGGIEGGQRRRTTRPPPSKKSFSSAAAPRSHRSHRRSGGREAHGDGGCALAHARRWRRKEDERGGCAPLEGRGEEGFFFFFFWRRQANVPEGGSGRTALGGKGRRFYARRKVYKRRPSPGDCVIADGWTF